MPHSRTKLEALAAVTKTVEPIKVREAPLDKDFTTVATKFVNVLAVKVENRVAATPPEKPH